LGLSLIYEFVQSMCSEKYARRAACLAGDGAREGNASEAASGATTCTKDSFRETEVQSQYCAGGKTVDKEWIVQRAAKTLRQDAGELA
jgi:hypothetical protein